MQCFLCDKEVGIEDVEAVPTCIELVKLCRQCECKIERQKIKAEKSEVERACDRLWKDFQAGRAFPEVSVEFFPLGQESPMRVRARLSKPAVLAGMRAG